MAVFTILSLSPRGLEPGGHPAVDSLYKAGRSYVYSQEWNTNAINDYTRNLKLNGRTFVQMSKEEVQEHLRQACSHGPADTDPLLARVLASELCGQAVQAIPTLILSKHIITRLPVQQSTQKFFFSGRQAKSTLQLNQPEYLYMGEIVDGNNWEVSADKKMASYSLQRNYTSILTTDAIRYYWNKSENKLAEISEDEFASLPSEDLEPLISCFMQAEVFVLPSERRQPAAYIRISSLDFVLYHPEVCKFSYINDLYSKKPRNPRTADAGYVPLPFAEHDSWKRPLQDTDDVEYWATPAAPCIPFIQGVKGIEPLFKSLNVLDSFFSVEQVTGDNVALAVSTLRKNRPPSTKSILELPMVVEVAITNPGLLSAETSEQLKKLLSLISTRTQLESSLKEKQAFYQQLIEKSKQYSETIIELELNTPEEDFAKNPRIPKKGLENYLKDVHFLAACTLLFFPAPDKRKKNISTVPYLNYLFQDRQVAASALAQESMRKNILERIQRVHLYSEAVDEDSPDYFESYRLYFLTENRIFTEPFLARIGDQEEKERLSRFILLLKQIVVQQKEQPRINLIIPMIIEQNKTKESALMSLVVSKNILPGEQIEPGLAIESCTFFIPSTQKGQKFHLLEKMISPINVLLPIYFKMVGQPDLQLVLYQRDSFSPIVGLFDLLTHYLDNTLNVDANYTCLTMLKEAFRYVAQVEHLPTRGSLNFFDEAYVPYEVIEIYQGKPAKEALQKACEQISTMKKAKTGIDNQIELLRTQIEANYAAIEGAPNLYPIVTQASQTENQVLREKISGLETQVAQLQAEVVRLRRAHRPPVPPKPRFLPVLASSSSAVGEERKRSLETGSDGLNDSQHN